MAYEQKPNTGSLFKSAKKTSDSHPTHAGTINIDGVEYWLNGWVNETKKGEKYFSLKVKPKEIKDTPSEKPAMKNVAKFEEDYSELPF